MNIQQLEYIIALDNERHFHRAAKACNISQPTLSMMIQKLEEELDTIIFDRSKKPVVPTSDGEQVLNYARSIIAEVNSIKYLNTNKKGVLKGTLEIAVIPTIAPYLIPLFVSRFMEEYPGVKLLISELTTENIISGLKQSKIDGGILVTPVNEKTIKEEVLFYEPFWVYSSSEEEKGYITSEEIDTDDLWLLEEGHCYHRQIFNLCNIKRSTNSQFQYHAGSIETLKRLVDTQHGITILPELATMYLNEGDMNRLRAFVSPVPVREVSICTHRSHAKTRIIEAVKQVILESIPEDLLEQKEHVRISVE